MKMIRKIVTTIISIMVLLSTIQIAVSAETKTIQLWNEIPNGNFTITNVHHITNGGYGWLDAHADDIIYVVNQDSTITFNSFLSTDTKVGYDGMDGFESNTNLLDNPDICTVFDYHTTGFWDNKPFSDSTSDLVMTYYTIPGLTVKFNEPGRYYIHAKPGYASRNERMHLQPNEYKYQGWQWNPTIYVWVVDTEPYAAPTASKIIVDGVETEFEAYNINGNNYFKLRDVAMAVNGTPKQFSISWDSEKDAISLLSSFPYTPVGGELTKGDGIAKTAEVTHSDVFKETYRLALLSYNINGNNYFKLRDIGQVFDFDVTWDGTNNCIVIDTANSYTAD